VLADLRAVWGSKIHVIQTVEAGQHALQGVDGVIFIQKKKWGDMEHFGARLDASCTVDPKLSMQRANGDVVFMPGWSAFAESPEAARAVTGLGLVWPGTEPVASEKLEKIGFKKICRQVGAPTPNFCVLADEGPSADLKDPQEKARIVEKYMASIAEMNTSEPGLIKSIHGGGGKGTAHLNDPSDVEQTRAAIEKVLNEMGRSDGVYFEEKVNQKGDGRFYQLEIEVDGEKVAHGGRFVWFNSRLQKVVEIGLSDKHIGMFMPEELYRKSREWSEAIARRGGNNTRATMEALVFKNEKGEFELQFIECNRRPQVENEALALLQQDTSGNRRYTFAELIMRAAGYPSPDFEPSVSNQVVLHARWLHGNPDAGGNIQYQAGTVLGMRGPRLDWVASELLAPGEISFTSDPQLGKAVVCASSWKEMCDRAVDYFTLRKPNIQGPPSTYAQTMLSLFSSEAFRNGIIASNETFSQMEIPQYAARSLVQVLNDQLSPILVHGYRPGEGIDPDRWPTDNVCNQVAAIAMALRQATPNETTFTKYARGEVKFDQYIESLRSQLWDQGGGWVTVAPRDTAQQGNDSESAGITSLSRRNAEMWAEKAGCVGYEIGGAQYQAGLIRGFDPAKVLSLGLPYNMPAHSLQRSQYVNGLAELPPSIRKALFAANAGIVSNHYHRKTNDMVPWFPYNFHAGNFYDPARDYSPQDQTTAELVQAGCTPLPVWVFSGRFTLEDLEKWTHRQITLFEKNDRTLHQVRIKNPGQGMDWTVDSVWAHIKTIRGVFEKRGKLPPIIYIHNHEFNGFGAHIARELFTRAQADGFPSLVIDGAYRKNGTHNDNTIMLSALNLSNEQREALEEYNHLQQAIEQVLCRFDSRTSQMTPWNSDWAGGTEGSDLRIAKEYNIDPRKINHAKEVASEVFPLERAVTPFSEYKLRLGIAIMIEDAIEPKTVENVKAFVKAGGKLKVGADVLIGLKRWETLVERPEAVDQLLENMNEEVASAMGQSAKLIASEDLPAHLTDAQRFTVLGFQQKGLDMIRLQGQGKDLTPLLQAAHVLHRKPRTLPPNTRLTLLLGEETVKIDFEGFGTAPNGDITVNYCHAGEDIICTTPNPDAVEQQSATGNRKADPSCPTEYGTVVPGELLSYLVAPGDTLEAGKPMAVLESMKMEVKIPVPESFNGHVVKDLPCKGRTAEQQGTMLSPGDLLMETTVPKP
jgi:biotin carboxylase